MNEIINYIDRLQDIIIFQPTNDKLSDLWFFVKLNEIKEYLIKYSIERGEQLNE